ncbi:type IV pilus twitching motility protein PilT [Candidatus Roizmanbacteria bacterium]|nr:MAG: type IV pilus twitching motility protein PilT [Candidatus Roizmanbacteria bacterium]
MKLEELFQQTLEKGASDLHIIPDYPPMLRIHNDLVPVQGSSALTKEQTEALLEKILNESQQDELHTNKETDFGYEWGDIRFRINYYHVKGGLAGAFRLIPKKLKTLEELAIPSTLHKLAKYSNGLVLLTGPTGEGKSTTISALLNEINITEKKHIITIEDPIEFVYPTGKSIISQRELHSDTHSWSKALRSVLREDPDVVLVGEMRDLETIQAALTIAETGHLVFSTLHTNSTPEAINRIIDVFPGHQQNQIRNQLATVLKAVVYQRLVPNFQKNGRIPSLEILFNTPAVSSLVREGKTFMIDNVLETGEEHEMILFDKYLSRLYKQNLISREDAYAYAIRTKEIEKFMA